MARRKPSGGGRGGGGGGVRAETFEEFAARQGTGINDAVRAAATDVFGYSSSFETYTSMPEMKSMRSLEKAAKEPGIYGKIARGALSYIKTGQTGITPPQAPKPSKPVSNAAKQRQANREAFHNEGRSNIGLGWDTGKAIEKPSWWK